LIQHVIVTSSSGKQHVIITSSSGKQTSDYLPDVQHTKKPTNNSAAFWYNHSGTGLKSLNFGQLQHFLLYDLVITKMSINVKVYGI